MPTRTTRRTFLKLTTAAASVTAAEFSHAMPGDNGIALIVDPGSALTAAEPVQWALEMLRQALTAKGIPISGNTFTVLVSPVTGPLAKAFGSLHDHLQPESTALIPGKYNNAPAILVTGTDARGIVYGLLELTERVRMNDNPITALYQSAPMVEVTPNKVRSVARAFLSEIEDKSWFYDRAFWKNYLDTIAFARFNRFNFALGFGYDFPRGVTGDYLHFPYPYLVELPGHEKVSVEPPLQTGERQRNLETLQFIAAETARRGLDFQLGIWTHAYEWTDSPGSDHHIVGLTPETHATYCRDALAAVLKACPQITGLTLRIHGESGIPEGSYPFWQTLFEAISGAGRVIEIDIHTKGLNQIMIDMAHKTGMPVKASAKFWAEHQGLGYHQADIREAEYPRKGVTGTFAVSSGERNFTRYGYGDFYGQRDIEVLYRVWPGTQRHLLWGDAALASGYGRAANFCGAAGMELCEPLTFKGREGSGHPGGRNAYADPSLANINYDTNKFAITYLLWGRHLYNPDTSVEVQRRFFRQAYGSSGLALEAALASSSRILPLITTAWLPSASNHSFWPELYSPISILPPTGKPLYTDSPAPHNVSAISPLDPQLFSTIDQHAKDLISGTKNARYSPGEVIEWIETMVRTSTVALAAARSSVGSRSKSPEFRQVEEDILVLNGLGVYYANLFRTALFYSIHELSDNPTAAAQSLAAYGRARDAWANMAVRADKIYAKDISYGDIPIRRGNWSGRLPEIDLDVTALKTYFSAKTIEQSSAGKAIQQAIKTPSRLKVAADHTTPNAFHRGSDLKLTITTPEIVTEAVLWYRHVNHGERWSSMPMQKTRNAHQASIPGGYTDSPYPLQYYFELHSANEATLHPPFNPTFSNQPYYAIISAH